MIYVCIKINLDCLKLTTCPEKNMLFNFETNDNLKTRTQS